MASFLAHSIARQTVWLEEPVIRSVEELLDIKEALDEFGQDFDINLSSNDSSDDTSNPTNMSEDESQTSETSSCGRHDLSCKDLYSVFQTVGTMKSTQRCQEMLDKCTVKGFNSFSPNGPVKDLDFPCLLETLLEEIQETITYDDLRKAFDIMDTDKDGYISVKNISQISSCFGEEQISDEELEAMIKAVDKEGTGLVTFEQFASIINPPNEVAEK